MTARSALARHPIAVESARAAQALTGHQVDIVVFEPPRAFVVATSNVEHVLQPRRLTEAEDQLVESNQTDPVRATDSAAFGFSDGGALIGALGVNGPVDDHSAAVLGSLARSLTSLVADITRPNGERFEAEVIQGLRDPVVVLSPELTIRWVNKAVGSLLGRTPAGMIGRSAADFLHPEDVETTLSGIVSMQNGHEMYRVFVRLERADGGWERVEVTGTDLTDHPDVGGLVISVRSANHESELERSKDRTESLSSAVVGALRDGIVATDEFGSITTVNAAARTMFGITPDASVGELSIDDFALLDGGGRRVVVDPDPLGAAPTAGPRGSSTCVIAGHGDLRYVSLDRSPVHDSAGSLVGSVLVFHDLTAEREAEAELRSQALHDQLTGLANRRQLEQRIAEIAASSTRSLSAAIFIDLDGFKLVNDTHGHRIGDQLIRIAAKRLRSQLRQSDLLVRQGGDEFVVLQASVESIDAAKATGERLRKALAETYDIHDQRFDLTASVGVATADSSDLSDEVILQHADIALYAAKARGRDRVEVFNSDLAAAVQLEEHQRRTLRSALENDRLVMHFQPLVETGTGIVKGYEALARVITEDGDLIGPAGFMEAVTSTGLIWDLDRAAFDLSCEAAAVMAELEPDDPPTIACNFSSFSITQPTFVATVIDTARRHEIDPAQICIEITESAAFDGGATSLDALSELHSVGFGLALDDFGTGYSSLAHLRDLPISTVKVDRSFVSKLARGNSERAIAEAVVSLAQDLGLGVVAEGVETVEHLENVRQLGFGTVQGWHYAPAMSLTDALAERQAGVVGAAGSNTVTNAAGPDTHP